MIYEVHRKVDNNVGDLYCNPSRYFDIQCNSGDLLEHNFNLTDQTVIIGGGGLIHKSFSKNIQDIIKTKPKNVILWGVGHNFGEKAITKGSMIYYPEWLKDCKLVGIRDWIEGHHNSYLPCVSCMHTAFDKSYNVTNDTVYFLHKYKTNFNLKNKVVMYNNNINFEEVIEFLGSANTIVTDSYHGAYWGQLLGKNVVVASWSVKFNNMKYSPAFINSINEPVNTVKNKIDHFLEECRNLNNNFYKKFKQL